MKENIFYKKSLTFSGNKKDPALLTVAKLLIAEPMDSPRGVSQSILASSMCQLRFIVHRNHQTYLII